ncbi:lipocalin-like domain-containing protein [Streptomyces chartreusis]|uniref:lipocalin-like domain-containing protein n=2 Tax=Streptomyces chartreusis TaxID=1969 RepID=UPI003AEFAD12
MLGEIRYEFALPSMRTTGTLSVRGRSHRVSGESWLDRQWGRVPASPSMRWTWMNLSSTGRLRVTSPCWRPAPGPWGPPGRRLGPGHRAGVRPQRPVRACRAP